MSAFPHREFHRFRWAHANANSFLLGTLLIIALIIGMMRWLLGVESPPLISARTFWWLVVGGSIAALIPRLGFYLARQIVGSWYQSEHFGTSYREYRRIEKEQDEAKKQSEPVL